MNSFFSALTHNQQSRSPKTLMADTNASATAPATLNAMMTMTMLMPTINPTLQMSLMPTEPVTHPRIKSDPSPPVTDEGIHHKTSPMSMPLPAVTMTVPTMTAMTPLQLMLMTMQIPPITMTQQPATLSLFNQLATPIQLHPHQQPDLSGNQLPMMATLAMRKTMTTTTQPTMTQPYSHLLTTMMMATTQLMNLQTMMKSTALPIVLQLMKQPATGPIDTPGLQHPVPVLAPICLVDFDCHLQKLDNLQGRIQQLCNLMHHLVVTLSATFADSDTSLMTHNTAIPKTSSSTQLLPASEPPYAITTLSVPPDPPEPCMQVFPDSNRVFLPNSSCNLEPTAALLPALLPTKMIHKAPTIQQHLTQLPNIKFKAHTPHHFAAAFLHLTKNHCQPS